MAALTPLGAELNGDPDRTVASTLNVSIPGVDSEAAIVALKESLPCPMARRALLRATSRAMS